MDTPVCSARGCSDAARWAVVWNNPKIHTPDREKVWTACDEHRSTLSDFLSMRSMLLRVDALNTDALNTDPLETDASDTDPLPDQP
ncbi:MAG: hypothetical protein L0H59_16305 [Tomitella sp.]|nr:hypothetical protein [Tomitella sp.]